MSSTTTITELRTMQIADLRKEIRSHRTHLQKMRLQITMNTEKDTGKYRRDKKQLARMMTVLTEKEKDTGSTKGTKETKEVDLNTKPKTARVAAPKKPRKSSKKSSKKSS